jgi:hypothetical protein
MWSQDFRTLYCQQTGCAPERFERHVFWRVLYPHAVLLALPVRLLMPNFFRLDFETIDRVGQTFDGLEFGRDLDRYKFLSGGLHSVLRSLFLVRISGRKLMRLRRKMEKRLQEQPAVSHTPAIEIATGTLQPTR